MQKISIHAPLRGERPIPDAIRTAPESFQSTLPYAGSDKVPERLHSFFNISIHAPLRGERRRITKWVAMLMEFQSTLPYAGSDVALHVDVWSGINHFNPRSPTRGATYSDCDADTEKDISIHAPLRGERPRRSCSVSATFGFQSTLPYAGSDAFNAPIVETVEISIHAPLRGERRDGGHMHYEAYSFQSTLPYAGSDEPVRSLFHVETISIHAPLRGERRNQTGIGASDIAISIHAPLRGERRTALLQGCAGIYFNPRSPTRGATRARLRCPCLRSISIHAPLRGERLAQRDPAGLRLRHFNPRSPTRGATLVAYGNSRVGFVFQSTLPYAGSDSNVTISFSVSG